MVSGLLVVCGSLVVGTLAGVGDVGGLSLAGVGDGECARSSLLFL